MIDIKDYSVESVQDTELEQLLDNLSNGRPLYEDDFEQAQDCPDKWIN